MIKSDVINTIEKAFRYIIPGFIFIFLFKLSFPSRPEYILNNIQDIEFYVYIPCIGMVIYGLHRVVLFTILEPILYLCNSTAVSNFSKEVTKWKKLLEYPTALARFLKIRHKKSDQKSDENLSGYLFYRWSIQHYSLILSELLFVAYFVHERNSLIECYKGAVITVASVIFIVSLVLTIIMYRIEMELYKK